MLFNGSALHNFQEYPLPSATLTSEFSLMLVSLLFPNSREAGGGAGKKKIQVQSRQKPPLSCSKVVQHVMSCDLLHCQPVIRNTMRLQSVYLLLPTPPGPYSSRSLVPDLEGWEPGDLCPHTPCSLGYDGGMGMEFIRSTRGRIHSLV